MFLEFRFVFWNLDWEACSWAQIIIGLNLAVQFTTSRSCAKFDWRLNKFLFLISSQLFLFSTISSTLVVWKNEIRPWPSQPTAAEHDGRGIWANNSETSAFPPVSPFCSPYQKGKQKWRIRKIWSYSKCWFWWAPTLMVILFFGRRVPVEAKV